MRRRWAHGTRQTTRLDVEQEVEDQKPCQYRFCVFLYSFRTRFHTRFRSFVWLAAIPPAPNFGIFRLSSILLTVRHHPLDLTPLSHGACTRTAKPRTFASLSMTEPRRRFCHRFYLQRYPRRFLQDPRRTCITSMFFGVDYRTIAAILGLYSLDIAKADIIKGGLNDKNSQSTNLALRGRGSLHR